MDGTDIAILCGVRTMPILEAPWGRIAACTRREEGSVQNLTEQDSSRFVETGRGRFHYNEAGSGHPVVLLHGSGPGASGWSNFKTNLEPIGKEFHAMAFDMPGWGKTETKSPDDRDHLVALVDILDALEIERTAVVGNSMGAMTALRFAVEYPDRVSHLIPMGSPGPGTNLFDSGVGTSEGLQVLMAAYRDPSPENFKALVSVMAYDQRFATDELAQERSANALAFPDHLKSFMVAMERRSVAGPADALTNLAARLSGLPMPTLIVHGRNDRTLPYENALRLVSLIPNSRLLLFNRCGHWAQLEHADEFNRVVMDFIRNN
jgi:2-hydroxy-6-oxonona-2,4-dienedioate hydrolase